MYNIIFRELNIYCVMHINKLKKIKLQSYKTVKIMTHIPESTKANTTLKSKISSFNVVKVFLLFKNTLKYNSLYNIYLLYTLFHCGRGSNMYLIFFKLNLIFCTSLLWASKT